MVIIGILSAVGIPRFFDRQTFTVRAFSDQTQSMLRYAQKVAIAQNRNVFVRLNGNSIALCFDNNCAVPVPAPAGTNSRTAATLNACNNNPNWFCEAPPAGVVYNSNPATQLFSFSPLGQPLNGNNANLGRLTISITGDGIIRNIFVEQETGYVHS